MRAVASEDDRRLVIENFPEAKPPLDHTGAGDAFGATVVAAVVTLVALIVWHRRSR